jgi:hypothetical protein
MKIIKENLCLPAFLLGVPAENAGVLSLLAFFAAKNS